MNVFSAPVHRTGCKQLPGGLLEKEKEKDESCLVLHRPVLNSQEASAEGLCVTVGKCSDSDPGFSVGMDVPLWS